MMFTKYIVVVDDDVDMHYTRRVLFRLCANAEPQRSAILTTGRGDVLDHATSEILIGTKLGIHAEAGAHLIESASLRNLFAW